MRMPLDGLADEVIESDILILGGGLAGCVAAIIAKKKNENLDVVLVEKAGIMRSGDGGRGVDHYPGLAHPKINGMTAEEYGHKRARDFGGGLVSTKMSIITAKGILKPLALMEEIGVKIREEDGTLKLLPGRHSAPVGGDFVLIRGADMKIKLAAEVRRRGVRVFERTVFTKLITKDGAVIGATSVDIRNGKFLVFKAKAILLATGGMQARMYNYIYAPFPSNLFIGSGCPTNCGSGVIAAYRAGARVTNLEFTDVHLFPVGMDYGPQGATHCSRMRNFEGEDLFEKYSGALIEVGDGHYPGMQTKTFGSAGNILSVTDHSHPAIAEETFRKVKANRGFYPWNIYAFMPDMSKPEIERNVISRYFEGVGQEAEWYNNFQAAQETPFGLKLIRDRGGLRGTPLELFPKLRGIPRSFSGILCDEIGETSLKGLFVAGDLLGGLPLYGGPGAYAWGYRVAEYLAEHVPEMKRPVFDGEQTRQVQEERERIRRPLGYKDGVDPLELEDLVRRINTHYVAINKVEPRLKRALELIKILKERFVPTLMAYNPHYLMRVLEVQDILDISELHAQTALIRTETRMPPNHYRMDYPEQDDKHWAKNIVVKSVSGEMTYTLEILD
jgi:succinate dehydrogenase/fumarate reductase flavoprotein subunit